MDIMDIRNVMMNLYKEIRCYGEISYDKTNEEENSRTIIIRYKGAIYQFWLKDGEVIEISEISAY